MSEVKEKHSNSDSKRGPTTWVELLYLAKIYFHYFVICVILAILATFYFHLTYVPGYMADAVVTMREGTKAAQVMAIPGMPDFGGGKSAQEEQLERYLSYVKSASFNLSVAKELKFRNNNSKILLTLPPKSRSLVQAIKAKYFGGGTEESLPVAQDLTAMPLEQIAEKLGFMLKPSSARLTIYFEVLSADPQSSVALANLSAETFVNEIMLKDRQEIEELQKFVDERLRETTEKLKSAELELVQFKQKNSIVSTAESGRKEMDRLGRLESDVEQLKIQIRENERLLGYYQGKLEEKNKELLSGKGAGPDTDETGALRSRIEALRKQRTNLRAQGLGDGESVVSEINKDIREHTERLRMKGGQELVVDDTDMSAVQNKILSLQSSIKALNVKLAEVSRARDDLSATVATLPKREQDAQALERAVAMNYELYTQLKKRQQELDLQKAGLKNPVTLDEVAQGANATLPPSLLSRLLFAIAAGIFLGSVIALFRELLNFTVKHRSDLDGADLVNLGNVPFLDTVAPRKVRGVSREEQLICARQPESAESMAFKFVRAQIRNLVPKAEGTGQVIAISSAERAAGKSFFSSNLAVAFSQLRKKTIVVDCDMRNPTLPKYFGFEQGKGLADLLDMGVTLSDVLIKDRMPNLDVLPAGRLAMSPTELLSGDRLGMLIGFLKKRYDYIVLDGPPALFVVDAAVLSAAADVTILVARYRQTKRQDLTMAHRKIVQIAPGTIFGVLNGVQDVHEYTNYDATTYFDAKFRGIRGMMDRRARRPERDLRSFEHHLEEPQPGKKTDESA